MIANFMISFNFAAKKGADSFAKLFAVSNSDRLMF